MGRTVNIEKWLQGVLEEAHKIPGGTEMRVMLVGPVASVQSMPHKEGKAPMDFVSVIVDGRFGAEIAKVLAPAGTYAKGQMYKGYVDVSVYQNRLSIMETERIDK